MAIATSKERIRQQLSIPLYRNAVYLMINYVVTGVFGLVFWVIAAKLYVPSDVGLASATISAMMLLTLFASLGLDYAMVRFLPTSGKDSGTLINSILTVAGLTAAAISAIFVLGLGLWSPALLYLQHHVAYAVAFVIFNVAYTLFQVQNRTFVGRSRSGLSLAQATVLNVFRMVLLIPLTAMIGMFGLVSSWGIAVLVALLTGAIILQPRVEAGYRPIPMVKWRVIRGIIRFASANYVAVLLWSGPIYLLPLMVANLVSTGSNAYFQIAWSLSNVLFQIPIGISFSMLAEGSSHEDQLSQHARRSLIFTFLMIIPAILLVVLFAHRLLAFFGADYASEATSLLRVLALSAVPVSINQLFFVIERVGMAMRRLILLHIFIASGTLAVSAILLPHLGIIGAGIAWLSSQSAASLVSGFWWWRDHATQFRRSATGH